jgi:hypothetical protein
METFFSTLSISSSESQGKPSFISSSMILLGREFWRQLKEFESTTFDEIYAWDAEDKLWRDSTWILHIASKGVFADLHFW